MRRTEPSYFQFKIIAGEFKGRIIKTPNLGITRPPLTRLRRAVFDFLNPYLDSANYLDLFSGTGSYLFEAVSRGATTACGIEMDSRLAAAINEQAGLLNLGKRLGCICDDVFRAIPNLAAHGKRFDIIMMAPPQYKNLVSRTVSALRENDLRTESGFIICQHDTSETRNIDFADFAIEQQRKYGNTTFTILSGQ
jgi:16S rRNA (guanine966-N2)-methyltransferase